MRAPTAVPPEIIARPPAHRIRFTVPDADIDGLNHVNNVAYVRYLERVAWGHSCALGLDLDAYRRLDRAMVVRHHAIDYLRAAVAGDDLVADTWIIANDGKLSLTRAFRLNRVGEDAPLLMGRTDYACIALSSGKPRRMPPEFIDLYRVTGG